MGKYNNNNNNNSRKLVCDVYTPWQCQRKSKAAIINKCKCKIDIRINNLSKLKQLLEVSELGFVQM